MFFNNDFGDYIMDYPVKFKVTKVFLEELESAESGRYEDALRAREGDKETQGMMDDQYDLVLNDFINRWKTQIEVRNDKELRELYYSLASGLIGMYGYAKQANKILDKIRPRVQEIDPRLVRVWPRQTGF